VSAYRIYIAKSKLIPSSYLGINLPFYVIFLLPAQNLIAAVTVSAFMIVISTVLYNLLAKQLLSDITLVVDDTNQTISLPNDITFGVISCFSFVTSRFVYICFNGHSFLTNKLIFLNKLNTKDQKRLLRAIYNGTK
jgi:hypothetical protein